MLSGHPMCERAYRSKGPSVWVTVANVENDGLFWLDESNLPVSRQEVFLLGDFSLGFGMLPGTFATTRLSTPPKSRPRRSSAKVDHDRWFDTFWTTTLRSFQAASWPANEDMTAKTNTTMRTLIVT